MKRVSASLAVLALAAVFFFAGIAGAIPTAPPMIDSTYMGDADGSTGIGGVDIIQHNNKILHKAYTYETLQPNNSDQAWNTCDMDSSQGCAGLDVIQVTNKLLHKTVSLGPDDPWSVNNINLPLSGNASGAWIPFNIDVHSTYGGLASGRPGISVVVEIDPILSVGTGQLSGRECFPDILLNLRDQAALTGAQCALSVSQTNWTLSAGTGPTESGTYGFQVMGDGNGDLNLKVYTTAISSLDIPATSTRLIVSFGVVPPTADIDCGTPGPNPVNEGQLIQCTVTGAPGTPIVNSGADTCGGTITAGIYSFTPGEGGNRNCIAAVINGAATDREIVQINDVNLQPTIAVTCPGSVVEPAAINCAIVVGDLDAPPDSLTCSLGAGDTCGGALTGCTNYDLASSAGKSPSCTVDVVVNDNAGQPNSTASDSKLVTVVAESVSLTCPASADETATSSCTITGTGASSCTIGGATTCTGVTITDCTQIDIAAQGETAGPGSCNVEVVKGSANDTKTITINEVNQAPTISVSCGSAAESAAGSCGITVGDADLPANTLTCSVAAATTCTGVTLTGCATANVPAQGEGGARSCVVAVTVDDNTGLINATATNSDNFSITDMYLQPMIALTCPGSVVEPDPINCTIAVGDGDAPPDSLTCSLGAGDTCGGTLTGCTNYDLASSAGKSPSCTVDVVVNDNAGQPNSTASDLKQVFVGAESVSLTCPANANEDASFSCTITAVGGSSCAIGAGTTCAGATLTDCTQIDFAAQGEAAPGSCDVQVVKGSANDTKSITIIETNEIPVITSTCAITATEDVAYSCALTATDADIPAQTLTWTTTAANTCGGTIVDNGNGTGTYTVTIPGPTPPASCVVGVQISDNFAPSGTDTQSTTISITAVDDLPVFSSTPPPTATEDVLYTYNIVTTDPEGDPIVLSVDATDTCGGSIVDNGNGTATYTFTAAGPTPPASCVVGIDAGGTIQSATISVISVDDPPVFSSTPPPTATEDVLYTYNIVTTDPESDPIALTVDASDTCGGSIVDNGNGTGTYTFTAAGPTPPASCNVGVDAGGTVQTTSISITAVDDLPVFSSTPPATATEDVLYTYDIVTTDPEGDPIVLTVDATDTCGGTIIDNGNGTGTYTFTAAGPTPPASCNVGVDAGGTVQTTTISITAVDDLPVFSSTPPATATEDVLYTYDIVTTDPEGDPIVLTVDATDTCGGTIIDNGNGTGTYTFTAAGPTPPASCNVGVDAGGTVQTTSISITAVDDLPVFSSTPPATATEDVLYTYNIVTTDPEGDPIVLTVDATDTCGGSIVDNGNGTGTYTFTAAGPTPPASCNVGVDAGGTVQTTSISITAVDDLPVFSSTPPATATEDVLYTYNIVTTDPEGDPIALSVDATDTCGGSIVDNGNGTGTYTFTAAGPTPPASCNVGVDAGGTVQTTSISITAVDDLPVFSSTPPATATEDVLYTYNIVTTDPEGDPIALSVDATDTCGGSIIDNGDGTGTYTFTAAGPTPPASCNVGVNASGTVQTTTISITAVDDLPVFSSTPPPTATEDVLYTYNIVTTDPEGNLIVLNVDVTDTCGGTIVDNGDGTGTYTFTAAGPIPPASCVVGIDAGGTIQSATISITSVDDPPVFSSTPPPTATEDVLYTYNIVTTDPEGDPIVLTVDATDTCGGSIVDNGNGTATYTFTAAGPTPPSGCNVGVNANGTVQTTSITIAAVDDLPVFSSTPPATATEDVLYTYDIVTTDPEGDLVVLNVDLTDTCGGTIVDNGDGTGTYTFTAAGPTPPASCVVGVDAGGTVQTTTISITSVNDLPVFSSTPPPTATEDVLYTYNIVTTDPESDPIVLTVDASDTCGGSIVDNGNGTGTYTFTAAGPTPPASCNVGVDAGGTVQTTSISITAVDDLPVFSSTPPPTATEDVLYTYNIVTTDPEGDPIALSVDATDTCGGSIVDNGNGTGTYTFTAAGPTPPANCNVGVNAGGTIQTTTITITSVNDAPTISTTAPSAATEDTLLSYDADFTDPDGPGATWSKLGTDTCAGSAIVAGTGVYTYTPVGPTPPANCLMAIQVCDNGTPNQCVSQTSTITIASVNDAPTISTTAPTAATEDTLLSYDADLSDPDGPGQTWSKLGTDTCAGSAIVAGTGVYTYTPVGPTPPASCLMAIQVCDNGTPNQCVSQTSTITITSVNDAPTISTTAPTAATEDTLLSYDADFTDPDGPGATWSKLGTDTCAGSSIVAGTGVYTYTPVGPTPPASCMMSIQVCDNGTPNLCVSQGSTITITAVNDAPTISTTAPTAATEDTLLSYDANLSDPDGPGQTWSKLGTDTCAGSVIVAGTGVYTYTPVGPTPPASCLMAIQVCDNGTPNLCVSQTSTITITAVNDAPTISTTAPTAATEDTLLSYDANLSDPDGPGQTWTKLGTDTCAGSAIVAGTGVYTYTPAGPTPPASCLMAIQVCDNGTPNQCVSQTSTITITAVNDAPTATLTCPASVRVPDAINCTIAFSDPEGTARSTCNLTGADTCGGTLNGGCTTYTLASSAGKIPSCVVGVQVYDSGSPAPNLSDTDSVSVTVSPPCECNWYVDIGATGTGTGLSWANAFTDIQAGITAASANQLVCVADGTYNIAATINMKTGVNVYGGFTPTSCTIAERGDPSANASIINGGGARRGILATGNSNFTLDGFTVTNCNATTGAGMRIVAASNAVTVSRCIFDGNTATSGTNGDGGGALEVDSSTGAIVTKSIFRDNVSHEDGGAILEDNASVLTIDRCYFDTNSTDAGGDDGGAIMQNTNGAVNTLTLTNSVFVNNHANSDGGAAYFGDNTTVTGCSLTANSANTSGGSIRQAGGTGTYRNNIFWGNTAPATANGRFTNGVNVDYSDIQGGCAATGATCGANNINADPLFVSGTAPFDLHLGTMPRSPCIEAGLFTGPPYDYEGVTRPQNLAFNMGAYESSIAGAVWYVDINATGSGTGTSWANAFTNIQSGVNAAAQFDQVWVADGTYTVAGTGPEVTMKSGVTLICGFVGNEATLAARGDPHLNPSIIDGANVSYHVIVGVSNSRIDGCTIQRGNANGTGADTWGAGIIIDGDVNISIENCILSANNASSGGGAMNVINGTNVLIFNSQFLGNISHENVTFGNGGGAIYIGGASLLTIGNSVFDGNQQVGGTAAAVDAGAIQMVGTSVTTISNSIFTNNVALSDDGGAIQIRDTAIANLNNCTFSLNSAYLQGGAVHIEGTTGILNAVNCIFYGNTPDELNVAGADMNVSYSDIQGGFTGTGNINLDPLFAVGPLGSFYLGQTLAGQGANSPCLNTGSNSAISFGLDIRTTRTDEITDIGTVDMGYHYMP